MKPRSSDGQFMRSPWRQLSSSLSFKGLASSTGLQSPWRWQLEVLLEVALVTPVPFEPQEGRPASLRLSIW
jgi:hypothetical protein